MDKFNVREDRLYTEDHEWASINNNVVKIGVTAYAVDQLGDITLINLDVGVGDSVVAGKSFGTIESVKTLSDLFSPVSGKIVSVNNNLLDRPELVNEDPYGEGWMIEIDSSNQEEINSLMSSGSYTEMISLESH